ncbi:PucR family transcriptional regulator [Actinomadura atramentaria]|uniref:PucR family transcriptional regulator n=1 Tax=Actinomadura atramentaria TaxID=1990 RepID=UPI000373D7C5|nr:PucR family transcriptional regulator [Actinomadura atramentaria]
MNGSETAAAVLRVLREDVGTLTDRVLDRIVAGIPSYAAVAPELLRPGVENSVRDCVAFLLHGHGRAEALGAASVGGDRAAHGIPVEDMLRAYRLGVRTVWERFAAEAARAGADPAAVLALAERMWDWADGVMVRAAREHRRVELENALDAQLRRGAFVRGMLSGGLDRASVALQAAAFGLDPDREYVPFRARSGLPARTVLAALEPHLPPVAPPVALLDGDVAGLLARRPRTLEAGITAGVGPAVRPEDAPASFARATRALETAALFGLTGVHDLADLGLRALVAEDREVGALLAERYLAPLADLPDVERTVVTYLAGGMHVDDAARALYVHPNTLRNRLRRFEDATGADLRDHATLAELWWALAYKGLLKE